MPEQRNVLQSGVFRVSLRDAVEGDCELLWKWRNEPETRRASFNTEFIPYERHKEWFYRKLNDEYTKIFIVLDESGKEIGQVRFDMDSTGASAEVSVSIDHGHRGKGYGREALRLVCQYAQGELHIREILAHIKEDNVPSINVFKKAGFMGRGLVEFRGQKAVEMVKE